ncbi:MAG: hypothetical protein K1X71_13145 [Pirellulales bacterium]|nr:hypothetical protein [Pirellulales bacterium]
MDEAILTLVGFWCVAASTGYFSSRPRQFVRLFVPAEETRTVYRNLLKSDFERGMRWMAVIQAIFSVAVAVFVALVS